VNPTSDPQQSTPAADGRAVPAPLVVAASLAGVEALLVAAQGVTELVALSSLRLVMGVTTAAFFLLYAAGLALCAWGLYRLSSVGRAPVVVAQLLQLAVATSFWGGSTTWVAISLAVVAVVVLAGIFHPSSLAALAADGRPTAEGPGDG
jgi:hypothetical protein